ncbi:Nucleotide-binding universal stress protein, UspA family [Chitinophaga sp. CF118]|uniref:universal stress protein n=1 Tax=Chitinophaga sp. CF118 TaxID=1884367 RepID=UPI0008F07C7A|nr:universal stress protein [Chitinophaga sp. CF118]SFD88314.1 Nucleotide-binding universal stress protein, UspA family [Chitinophaga sp. CF118]
MKSMLILTDFSEAALRAAEYACELVDTLQIRRIVLYHAYQTVVGGTDLPIATAMNDQEIYLKSMEALGMMHDRLKSLVGQTVKIDMLAEDTSFLPDLLNQLCRKEAIDLIVMGVSGKSALEKLFMGNVTAQTLRSSEFPVLIVPQDTIIGRAIKGIVLTTDLKDFSTIPVTLLYQFLDAFPAEINVVNITTESEEKYSLETEESIKELHSVLEKYQPAFHYIKGEDIVPDILSFTEQHKASLIITVPKKHGFLSTIFHKSISKKLAYNSPVPLLSLPALH